MCDVYNCLVYFVIINAKMNRFYLANNFLFFYQTKYYSRRHNQRYRLVSAFFENIIIFFARRV